MRERFRVPRAGQFAESVVQQLPLRTQSRAAADTNRRRSVGVPASPADRVLASVDMSTPTQGPPAAAGKVVGIDDIDVVEVASQLWVLAQAARVTILSLLFKNPVGEECGRVLAATIGLPETTVSHHGEPSTAT
jgi:hypothetical protein